MGIWGEGNFDSDQAYNTLGHLFQHIVSQIRVCFTFDSQESLYDDLGERQIMANIDILCTLCEHYETVLDLKLEEATKWKKDYLDTFDRTIDEYRPKPGFKEGRREVIAATFDRLSNNLVKFDED